MGNKNKENPIEEMQSRQSIQQEVKVMPGCGDCFFARPDDPEYITYQCRRNPPVPTDAINANHPRVKPGGWCGEWKKA